MPVWRPNNVVSLVLLGLHHHREEEETRVLPTFAKPDKEEKLEYSSTANILWTI